MKMLLPSRLVIVVVILGVFSAWKGFSQGIPEPSLIFYGTVRNTNNGANVNWDFGTITWTITPQGGNPVVLTGSLTNINDQFSYVLEVPAENSLGGFTPSTNTLPLSSTARLFDRSVIMINGTNRAYLANSAQNTVSLSALDRGRLEQLDMNVNISLTDLDLNGLPDDWERFYFGYIGVDPNDDPDHDGMTNLQEFLAGTNPNDPNSRFQIVRVSSGSNGTAVVQWSSEPNKTYAVQRSASLLSGFSDIATNIVATPPTNTFTDSPPMAPGGPDIAPRFYRLRLFP